MLYLKGFRKGLLSLLDRDSLEYINLLKGIVDYYESLHDYKYKMLKGLAFELLIRLLNLKDKLLKIVEIKSLSNQEKEHVKYIILSYK